MDNRLSNMPLSCNNHIEKGYIKGRDGKYVIKYYKNKNIRSIKIKNKGCPETKNYYYSNGSIKSEKIMRCSYISYYKSGDIRVERFINNKYFLTDISLYYYNNGILKSSYVYSYPYDTCIRYFKNGKIKSKFNYCEYHQNESDNDDDNNNDSNNDNNNDNNNNNNNNNDTNNDINNDINNNNNNNDNDSKSSINSDYYSECDSENDDENHLCNDDHYTLTKKNVCKEDFCHNFYKNGYKKIMFLYEYNQTKKKILYYKDNIIFFF